MHPCPFVVSTAGARRPPPLWGFKPPGPVSPQTCPGLKPVGICVCIWGWVWVIGGSRDGQMDQSGSDWLSPTPERGRVW